MTRFPAFFLAFALASLFTACSKDDGGSSSSTSATTFCSTCENPPPRVTTGKVAVTPIMETFCGTEASVNSSKSNWLTSNAGGACTANQAQ